MFPVRMGIIGDVTCFSSLAIVGLHREGAMQLESASRYFSAQKLGCTVVVFLILVTSVIGQTTGKSAALVQAFRVITMRGAHCWIRQDDKVIDEFVAPSPGSELAGKQFLLNALSRDDIIVTCAKDGYEAQSKVISYGPSTWIEDFAPCLVPKDSTSSGNQEVCANRAPALVRTIIEYPESVSLYLKRKKVK